MEPMTLGSPSSPPSGGFGLYGSSNMAGAPTIPAPAPFLPSYLLGYEVIYINIIIYVLMYFYVKYIYLCSIINNL